MLSRDPPGRLLADLQASQLTMKAESNLAEVEGGRRGPQCYRPRPRASWYRSDARCAMFERMTNVNLGGADATLSVTTRCRAVRGQQWPSRERAGCIWLCPTETRT